MITSIINLWELQWDLKVKLVYIALNIYQSTYLSFYLNQYLFYFSGAATLHLTGLEDVKVVASEQSDIEADDISVRYPYKWFFCAT